MNKNLMIMALLGITGTLMYLSYKKSSLTLTSSDGDNSLPAVWAGNDVVSKPAIPSGEYTDVMMAGLG